MIDRQGGRICIECDSCNEVFDGESGAEFAETWARAKEDGWKASKVGNDFIHSCPSCVASSARRRA